MPNDAATAMLTRRAGLAAPRTLNRDARTVEVVAATATPVERPGPNPAGSWEPWVEVLDIGRAGTSRFVGGPVLLDHRNETGALVGSVQSARVAGDELLATIRFAGNERGSEALSLVEDGHLRGVSIGYRITGWKRDGDTFTATIDILEISLTPIPADPNARIRSVGPETRAPKEGRMPNDTATAPAEGTTTTRTAAPERIRALLGDDEMITGDMLSRRAEALAMAVRMTERHELGDDVLRRVALAALRAADADTATQEVRNMMLDALADRDPLQGRVHEPATVGTTWDSPAALRAKLADARAAEVCTQLGLRHEPTIGREVAGLDGTEQARWYAGRRGERFRTDRQAVEWFSGRAGGYHTTSDFPLVAAGTVEVVVGRGIEQAPIALLECVRRLPASDHRARNYVHHSSASPLRDVLEAGELQYVTIDERGEPLPGPVRKAAGFRATAELIRNSLTMGVTLELQISRAMIEAANEALRLVIGNAIKSPPAMSDALAVFEASRGNVGDAGTPGQVGLSAARSAMARFTDSQGTARPVTPGIILGPPEFQTVAEKSVADIAAAKTDDVNVFSGRMRVLSDPELPGTGGGAFWYVLGDPAGYDGLSLIHLDDMAAPRIETREAWETFGSEWRLQWPLAAAWLRPTWWRAPFDPA